MHWGIQDRPRSSWKQPSAAQRPADTIEFGDKAVRTPFEDRDGLRWLTSTFPIDDEPSGIGLVLFQPDSGRWLKPRGGDLFLKVLSVLRYRLHC